MAVALAFVACDDDDEVELAPTDDDEVELAPMSGAVVGEYTGKITMAFQYATLEYDDKTVTLTANGDYAVDVALDDDDLGTACIVAVPVERNSDGSYALVETDGILSMPNHSGGHADYPCLVSGTVGDGKGDYSIVFSMPGVMGGTTYTLTPADAD